MSKQIPELTIITTPTAGQESIIETVVARHDTYATSRMTLAQIFTLGSISGSIKVALDALSGLISGNTTSINTLSSTKLNIAWGTRTGLTAKAVVATDASGNEVLITGTVWQQIGFDASNIPVALTPTVNITGLSTATTVADTDEYVQYNQSAAANRKITGKTVRKVAKKLWGNGADGAVNGTANITVTGSNNTYIQKNYTSWAAASGGAKTLSITPTNCILHIKISGDADFTNWTFDGAGKGGQWSAWVVRSTVPWNPWSDGQSMVYSIRWGFAPRAYDGTSYILNHWEGGNSQLLGYKYLPNLSLANQYASPNTLFSTSPEVAIANLAYSWLKAVSCGSGWSGGSSNQSWDSLGTGWHGGLWLIIEVAGNVTFSTTAVNCQWTGWLAFTPYATSTYGWGGGGWSVLIIYWGTRTGNPTINVAGGTQAGGNAGKAGDSATLSLDELP